MKIICSWCEKNMGEKPPLDDPRVTHGMCEACIAGQAAEYKKWLLSERGIISGGEIRRAGESPGSLFYEEI